MKLCSNRAGLRFPAAMLLALVIPLSGVAQTPATPARVLTAPSSVRAMALGGAYMTTAGHADAVFYHPALLSGSTGFGVDLQRWGGAASAVAASAATAWWGGSVGIGVQTLHAGLEEGRDEVGEDALLTHGAVPLAEQVATVGWARRIFGVRVGVSGKVVDLRLDGARSTTLLADVGVAHGVGPVTLAATLKDLGRDPFETGGGLGPARLVVGAGAYGGQVGPLDVGLAAALSHGSEETSGGGGLEVGYWPISGRTFVARIGVRTPPAGSAADPLTLGFAFWGDRLALEWAYQGYGGAGAATHRFGVRWR